MHFALVNGGLRNCHKTKLMSNLGRTLRVLGRSISNDLIQFLIMTLLAMSGILCMRTDYMAALCTLIVAG